MKKIWSIVLAGALAFSMAACGSTDAPSSSAAPEGSQGGSEAPDTAGQSGVGETASAGEDGKYEIAMITDVGTIDDKSFNQGTWEGIKKYADEHSISHKYYQPAEKSDVAYLNSIDLAVQGGAKVIVTPGFLFEAPIYEAQATYPDVNFILVDGYPNDGNPDNPTYRTDPNTVGIKFAEEQVGFLAGYAAVKDGYTKLGFLGGMAVPAVVNYGYGFIQGAEYAAKELGLADGSVTMNYNYTGGFLATPEAQALAASWYQSGTEVIFGCGGAVGNSAMAAAEQANGKVIGVDVDQSAESATVITSAMKGLGASVYQTLGQYYDGSFPGGQSLVMNAANDGVSMAMDTAKFEKFTQADYDALFAKLVADEGGIASNIVKNVDASGASVEISSIPTAAVKVTVVQ